MFTFYPVNQSDYYELFVPDSFVVLEKNTRLMESMSVQECSLSYKPFSCSSVTLENKNKSSVLKLSINT